MSNSECKQNLYFLQENSAVPHMICVKAVVHNEVVTSLLACLKNPHFETLGLAPREHNNINKTMK